MKLLPLLRETAKIPLSPLPLPPERSLGLLYPGPKPRTRDEPVGRFGPLKRQDRDGIGMINTGNFIGRP